MIHLHLHQQEMHLDIQVLNELNKKKINPTTQQQQQQQQPNSKKCTKGDIQGVLRFGPLFQL